MQNTFSDIVNAYDWDRVGELIYSRKESDVEQAIRAESVSMNDFAALISPAADSYLENMALQSRNRTLKRFGNTIQLYVPVYLSNECQNICTYCGFSMDVKMERKTLSENEILNEILAVKKMGYDHILLVSGEANKTVGMEYFRRAIELIKPHFSHISMEVQPLSQQEYAELASLGVNSVLVYQETYRESTYKNYHPKGKKSNYHFRLQTPDRLGAAGMHKIGLGSLIGLEDWRIDTWFTALHLNYLRNKYWRSKFSLSFPRLRPCAGGIELKSILSDRQLIQLICAYRIFDEFVELSLSTRESEKFRNHALKIGITTMSAGSKTNPGGYSNPDQSLEQFEVHDKRSTLEIANLISKSGYEPVWKDWDPALSR